MLAWIAVTLVRNLHNESYVKDLIPNNAFIDWLNDHAGDLGAGMLRQRWFFFAPDAWSEMGCVVAIGTTGDGIRIDLNTDQPVPITREGNKMVFGDDLKNTFSGSDWTFAMYVRRYYRDIPEVVFQRWLRYEYEQWQERHENQRLREVSLVLFINKTKVVDGEVQRKHLLKMLARESLDGSK